MRCLGREVRDGGNTGRKAAQLVTILTALLLTLIPIAQAATLVITVDGEEYIGDVVSAGMNTMTIKLSDTGYKIVPLDAIARVRIDTVDGTPVEGDYLDWTDGKLVVRVGDRQVTVRDGVIDSVSDEPAAAGGPKLTEPTAPLQEQPAPSEPDIPESGPITSATM